LEFGIYDTPKDRVDLEFNFLVHGEIIEPEPAMAVVD